MHPQDIMAAIAVAAGAGTLAFIVPRAKNRLFAAILTVFLAAAIVWSLPRGKATLLFILPIAFLLYFAIGRSRRHRRRELLRRDLPTMLDSLVLGVEAGHALIPALMGSAEILGEKSPLTAEINRLKHDVELGASHPEAIDRMRERLGLSTADAALGAISQALLLGTPIGRTLKEQSGRIRESLILDGEQFANTLSVKLLIPLLLFIFPASFLVILSPIIVTLIGGQPW